VGRVEQVTNMTQPDRQQWTIPELKVQGTYQTAWENQYTSDGSGAGPIVGSIG
jgi:hypothetical protein